MENAKELIAKLRKALKQARKDSQYLSLRGNQLHREVRRIMRQYEPEDSYGLLEVINSYSEVSPVLCYNTGDTYSQTVLAYVGYEKVSFKLGCWGDLIESKKYRNVYDAA